MIIVTTQPKVHAINVRADVRPDPLQIVENDVVYWSFKEEKVHDVVSIYGINQAINPPSSRTFPPRYVSDQYSESELYFYLLVYFSDPFCGD